MREASIPMLTERMSPYIQKETARWKTRVPDTLREADL